LYATGLIVKIHYYHDVMTAAQNPQSSCRLFGQRWSIRNQTIQVARNVMRQFNLIRRGHVSRPGEFFPARQLLQ
jgi:hypothetical protein